MTNASAANWLWSRCGPSINTPCTQFSRVRSLSAQTASRVGSEQAKEPTGGSRLVRTRSRTSSSVSDASPSISR